ncbi:MAG: hypothetical protein EA398_14480 [Deltaproteobacteria bacterium]|nr:MAG: hypothetical protein EA398_14480 [Deltaproteobacteria bacterium]
MGSSGSWRRGRAVVVWAGLGMGLLLAPAACSPPDEPGASPEDSAVESAPAAPAEREVAEPGAAADGAMEQPGAEAAERALHERVLALGQLLEGLGWSAVDEVEVDSFVISPQGTRTASGVFGREEERAAVGVFVYPNERHAQPHAVDLRERLRLLPGRRESGLHAGRVVVHVRAETPGAAESLVADLGRALAVRPLSVDPVDAER